MIGWISIHRKIKDHWVWEDDTFSRGQAWVDLLLMASHKDSKFVLGNELIEIERGSFVTSELKLASSWGWSRTKVRGFLKLLESDGMIVRKTDTKKTTLTIVNYNDYQILETTKEQQKNNKKTTREQRENTINNDNNINNDNKGTTRGEFDLIISEWNKLNLNEVIAINQGTNRHKMLLARLKEYSFDEIVQAIRNINKSPFLKGQNKNNWVITFDWLIRPNNFIKVLEGNYEDKGASDGGHTNNFNKAQGEDGEERDLAKRAGVISL